MSIEKETTKNKNKDNKIFYPNIFNFPILYTQKYVNNLLDNEELNNYISNTIIIIRHPEVQNKDSNKQDDVDYTYEGEKRLNGIVEEIKKIIGNNGSGFEIFYSQQTLRIKKLKEALERAGLQCRFTSTAELNRWNSKNNSNYETSVLNEIGKNVTSFYKENKGKNCIILSNSSVIGPLDYLINGGQQKTTIDPKKIKEGGIKIYNLDGNGKPIDSLNFLKINQNNIDEILEILQKDNIFSNIINKFKNGEIHYNQLVNTINLYFKKYNLYEKYLNSENQDLFDFCLENILNSNYDKENIIEIILEKFYDGNIKEMGNFFKIINLLESDIKTQILTIIFSFNNSNNANLLKPYLTKENNLYEAWKKLKNNNFELIEDDIELLKHRLYNEFDKIFNIFYALSQNGNAGVNNTNIQIRKILAILDKNGDKKFFDKELKQQISLKDFVHNMIYDEFLKTLKKFDWNDKLSNYETLGISKIKIIERVERDIFGPQVSIYGKKQVRYRDEEGLFGEKKKNINEYYKKFFDKNLISNASFVTVINSEKKGFLDYLKKFFR